MSNPRLVIAGARVIDPASHVDEITDVWIDEGKIAALGGKPDGFSADIRIDATGLIVCPGLVDLCARTREPGLEHKATIRSECMAAARGGITTLVSPPDTDPIIDTPAVIELIHRRANSNGCARVEVLGALTQSLDGERLSEMGALSLAGCLGVTNALVPIRSTQIMRRAMEYASTFGLTVFVLPSDPWLAADGQVHEGAVSTRLGMPGLPETAETIALSRDLLLAEQTGARLHVLHVSTRRGVEMIAQAKARGLPVSANVTAHHLHLCENQALDFNSECHVFPPLRSESDRDGLQQGLADGTIEAICSDHQPHEKDAKLNPFPTTEPGISALETLLALALECATSRDISLSRIIASLTSEPARILGLSAGTLKLGTVADICIFDPHKKWTMTSANMVSRGHNSPFLDRELTAEVRATVLGGKIVYQAAQ